MGAFNPSFYLTLTNVCDSPHAEPKDSSEWEKESVWKPPHRSGRKRTSSITVWSRGCASFFRRLIPASGATSRRFALSSDKDDGVLVLPEGAWVDVAAAAGKKSTEWCEYAIDL